MVCFIHVHSIVGRSVRSVYVAGGVTSVSFLACLCWSDQLPRGYIEVSSCKEVWLFAACI